MSERPSTGHMIHQNENQPLAANPTRGQQAIHGAVQNTLQEVLDLEDVPEGQPGLRCRALRDGNPWEPGGIKLDAIHLW